MSSTRGSPQGGFTLLEIMVVMGLLFVFMTFLTTILFDVTDVFSRSRKSQDITQRMVAAWRPLEECLSDMAGPTQRGDRGSNARLLVQWAGEGLQQGANRIQVLRSTVRIDPQVELALVKRREQRRFVADFGEVEDLAKDPRFQNRLAKAQQHLGGRGEMLLVPWPEGDAEGAFLELRRGLFLPKEPLPFNEAEGQSLTEVRELGPPHFPAPRVLEHTEVVASGLLHLEYRLKSHYTTDWAQEPNAGGPEWVWDSARAGWFDDAKTGRERFTLDLANGSFQNATDDVYPYWVEYTLVVGARAGGLPDAALAEALGSDTKEVRLVNTDHLPAPLDIPDRMLKIGSEWVSFGSIRGRTLMGLRRGLRGTKAKDHPRGTGVRAGSTRVLRLRILHGRDYRHG